MNQVEKASKRHTWSDRSPADAYECGFVGGTEWLAYELDVFLRGHENESDRTAATFYADKIYKWFQDKRSSNE